MTDTELAALDTLTFLATLGTLQVLSWLYQQWNRRQAAKEYKETAR